MMRRCTKPASIVVASVSSVRRMHLPGWRTSVSTKDARSKEQKELDRKARQIEKLPRPIAMHDYQYPYEKTVLADHMFQPIVFDDELDTPHLYNRECPSDFFLYWNVHDFTKTEYPDVPAVDHRLLPIDLNHPDWSNHTTKLNQYLKKHGVLEFLPQPLHTANLSVVYSGTYETRARTDEEGNKVPPPPPETLLTKRNFWFTAHAGNYMDLHELQQPPSIFFHTASSTTEDLYTLVMSCPDYPYRAHPNQGHMLHYIVANMKPSTAGVPCSGDVIVPYIPPLPTEDGGSVRVLCTLYKQNGHVASQRRAVLLKESLDVFPFAQRSDFRLHDTASVEGKQLREQFPLLVELESKLTVPKGECNTKTNNPVALTFFTTTWDIQVQEFYESIKQPEPAYAMDEELEAILQYLARPGESMRIGSRYMPDGTTNDGVDPRFWSQFQKTLMGHGTAEAYLSRRTLLGTNKKPVIRPHSSRNIQ